MKKPENSSQNLAPTISDDYRRMLTEKHASEYKWGQTGIVHYEHVLGLIPRFKAKSILDYGCGKGLIGARFRKEQSEPGCTFKDIEYFEYDPGIPEKMHDKSKADIVLCTDVLEHIEPEFLDNVLEDLKQRTLRAGFFIISCRPAYHFLPDGRNAHLIIEQPSWWIKKLNEHFVVVEAQPQDDGIYTLVLSKAAYAELAEKNQIKIIEDYTAIDAAKKLLDTKEYSKARGLLQTIKNKQTSPEIFYLLGEIAFVTEEWTKAVESLLTYTQFNKSAEAYRMAGIALSKLEQYQNALKCLELDVCKAHCMDDPAYREALMLSWSRTHTPAKSVALYQSRTDNTPALTVQYIDALIMLQAYGEAHAAAEKATNEHPGQAILWSALERALTALRKFEPALAASLKCIELEPENAVYHCNLGMSYLGLARTDEALAAFNKATELDHLMMAPYLNRSTIHRYKQDYAHLAGELEKAYEIDPTSPDVHYGIGVNAFKQEQYELGFAEVEWYWHKNKLTSARMPTSIPRWYGEPLAGKTLMVFADQGVGDTIMMLRYVPLVISRYNPQKIILNLPPKMHSIATTSFQELFGAGKIELFQEGNGTQFLSAQVVVATTTLPHVFNSSITTLPATGGYLKKRDTLDYKSGTGKEFVIGLSWYTKSLDAGFIRSLRLEDFSFLAKYDNIRILNLQYGDTAQERAEASAKGFTVYNDEKVDTWQEMQPLLDQIAACDLVISIDNTTVHAAGAIGKPCWVILPEESYWRWPISGESTPWYESLRLFRQQKGQTYAELFKTIEASLGQYMAGNTGVLTPPKFTPQFAQKQKPEKQAFLLNDSGAYFTWGNHAAMEGLKNGLKAEGFALESYPTAALAWFSPNRPSLHDFDDPKFLAACRYRDPTLFWRIEQSDIVIINGEGMMNSLTDTALQLLYLAYVSKRFFNKPVSIINHSCFPEGGPKLTDATNLAFYHKVYSILNGCVTREPVTQELLKSIGVPSALGMDTSILWLEQNKHLLAGVQKNNTAVITAGPGYESQYAQNLAAICELVAKRGFKPKVLLGAKWHILHEDLCLKNDLAEFCGNTVEIMTAPSIEAYAKELAGAGIVISGCYQTCIMSFAMTTPCIPLSTGSNLLSLAGLDRAIGLGRPLFYDDKDLMAKITAAMENISKGAPLSADILKKLTPSALNNIKVTALR